MNYTTKLFLVVTLLFFQLRTFPQSCDIDTREASTNPAVGKVGSGTCWIAPNGKLVTAAHCSYGYGIKVKFNMYTDNQTCADEDIYDVIPGSIVRGPFDFQNPVPGDDWAVFSVEPNPITHKYPIEQQQAYLNITQDFNLLETSILRITGHGYTDNCSICTRQRTATGPYVQ